MDRQFRKQDCVVLILSIIFVIFIIGGIGQKGQELNKRLICASNVRQLTSGLINIAKDNDGIIPTGSGFWPCDLTKSDVNSLLEGIGVPIVNPQPAQDVIYCPTYQAYQRKDRSSYWTYPLPIMDYFFLWQMSFNQYGQLPILGSGNKQWVKTIYVDKPAETELVIDIICSQKRDFDPVIYPKGYFGYIEGSGFVPSFRGSNHLKTNAESYGGNVGFVDGHVEWRPLEQMQLRYKTSNPSLTIETRWWW